MTTLGKSKVWRLTTRQCKSSHWHRCVLAAPLQKHLKSTSVRIEETFRICCRSCLCYLCPFFASAQGGAGLAHPYRIHANVTLWLTSGEELLFSGACLPVRLKGTGTGKPDAAHLCCTPGTHTAAITEAGELIAWCGKLLHHDKPCRRPFCEAVPDHGRWAQHNLTSLGCFPTPSPGQQPRRTGRTSGLYQHSREPLPTRIAVLTVFCPATRALASVPHLSTQWLSS